MSNEKSIPLSEQETIVTGTNDQETWEIYSSIRRHITAMRKHPAFTEIEHGFEGTTPWARFTVKSADWNPASGGKHRKAMTPEQRARMVEVARERFAKARHARPLN